MVADKQLSPIGGSSVPVPNRMLRLLKKATSISDLCPGSQTEGGDLVKDGVEEEEEEMRSDLEGLGVEDGVNARKALDFDSVPELNPVIEDLGEKSKEVISDLGTREETRVFESSVPEIDDPASEESGEKVVEEISDFETRVLESSVPEIDDPESEELSEKDEEEIPDLETREGARVLESTVPEIDPASEELGEKSEEEISDLETREETRVSESIVSEELGEVGEDEVSEMETEEGINVWGSKGVRKKRQVLEASDSEGKKTKRNNNKRSKKNVDFDDLPTSTASMNMTKKVAL